LYENCFAQPAWPYLQLRRFGLIVAVVITGIIAKKK
jgi:hypothetical protein